ncbi:MAG: SusC/RagA family TonB-linked outer membrane protein [Flammeovirgaceae bacterium]|nr:SusC/RagA family TonB-linked outer membrane protein [Flammeovirgaceae bacterium]HCX24304.1 SusC/RagA family TonB-linked outer membrane protein [Cytophagales bacterium]|tara:strand:- start:791 stop:3925 length:3135 start_codon:yes stop_codon:yes gene_type:complete
MRLKILPEFKGLVRLLTVFGLSLFWGVSYAQEVKVTGTVTDKETGETLPGVTVLVEGASNGTITDIDGVFTLNVPSENAKLIFSFVGFTTQEIELNGRSVINVTMDIDIQSLEEVVVTGYGTQKKSVVTGAISSIKASDLESMPINRVEQALQGRTSGLTIAANSGQPGSSATVRVRGITSLNNNDPLWVVDGVVVDNGGIGYLNQSDIASIEVLKDAASQAIYGARAAAGVILVTTKKGQKGSMKVSYNGFYGSSAPARKLDLLNATEYATLRNESQIAAGKAPQFSNPASLGEGTDWQEAIFNSNAIKQNHEVSFSGGNDISTFYTSFGFWDQEGIVASDISQYTRYNIRVNSTHKLTDWLTFGENIGYAREKSVGLGNTNSEFGGPLSSAINLDPITPLVVTGAAANGAPYTNTGIQRDANGNPYGISTIVGQEMTNPLAYIQTRKGNFGWSDNVIGNTFFEVAPIDGLKIRSNLGVKLAFWGSESFTPVFWLNSSNMNTTNSFYRGSNKGLNYNVENTVSYTRDFAQHNVSVMLGQGAYMDNNTNGIGVTYRDIPATDFDGASMNYSIPSDQITASGYEGAQHKVSSIFARLNYNFDEKYLLTAVMRRDGSSRFGSNNKYGFFPSMSLGWVTSSESFFPKNDVVNFLKIRGGYGVVGNDNIGDFAYLATVGGGRNYAFGTTGAYYNGVSPNSPSNPDLKWESTSQLNVGFEASIFHDVTVTFDWYKKVTSDILMNPRIPAYVGAISNPAANVATMENRGVELELGYRKNIGDLYLGVNGNVSYLQNEVTDLGTGVDYLSGGQSFQASSYPITRTAVGEAINSFYGFRRLGIFQNEEEVRNYTNSEGGMIQPNAKPGDFMWEDVDGDGSITEADRTFIGDPTPNWSYGLTVNLAYKGFDLVVFGQGVAGNMIFQGLRRLDVTNANYQTAALGRWTGEGTSNDYPRLIDSDPNGNFTNPSDFYLEKGDYFRFKTVQLGYTLPTNLIAKAGIDKVRVYLMAENLLTFTKYTGYDPEIGGGVMSIDRGIYPQARTYMLGLNFNF